jgi:N-acetyl-beta-hexosaminidase
MSIRDIKTRLDLGRNKYGHGVRVNDDTMTWGTPKDSWMEMAREEFLDGIIYVVADYIKGHREANTDGMESAYIYANNGNINNADDNDLIIYILRNWNSMEECRHKPMLLSLFTLAIS